MKAETKTKLILTSIVGIAIIFENVEKYYLKPLVSYEWLYYALIFTLIWVYPRMFKNE